MITKIVIVGLGGVGGYYGGLLAKRYADDPTVEIYFVARKYYQLRHKNTKFHKGYIQSK